ncbi:unannotated protein [freshwater metagenome]|uniref:Unannotated protein n=1 Tax=freshwater metagenome TaxID=449393 RepID=A0A6J6CKR4_9ZZZZ
MLFKACIQGRVSAHHQSGHGLGYFVANGIGLTKDSGGISHGGSSLDGREGHDLSNPVSAVAFGGVTDHLIAVAGVEVHIDIRHGHPAGIQETFKQQIVFDWIKVGNPQAVRNCAACC